MLLEQETEALIDRQVVTEKAVELVENQGIDLPRRTGQDLRPAIDAWPGRVAPGRAARSAAGRRGHHRQHALWAGAHRSHSVHRRRGVSSVQAVGPDAGAAGPISRSASS